MHALSRKRIKNYCPFHKVESEWHWRKTVIKPLFPSFVFVYLEEENLAEIRHTHGVLDYVYWLNEPVVVTAGEINTIRTILKEYENVTLEKTAVKREYMGLMAETLLLLEKNSHGNNAVKIILPSLGYYLIAECRKGIIELPK